MKRKAISTFKVLPIFLLVLLILSSFLISGCSLIFGPSGSIEVDTYPSGAKVFLNGNDTGKITPCTITNLKKGTYEITVTLGDLSHTEKVIVYSDITTSVYKDLLLRLSKIIVQPSSMNLEEGDSQTIDSITAYYFNSGSADIKLSACSYSSNSNHATVNSVGTITGVSKGLATITVSYTDVKITKTDTINVNVTTIPVEPPPTACINVSPGTTGIVPFTVSFDASDSYYSIVSYSWDFGDGSISTGIAITHTYNDVGIYAVVLTVTDSDGKKGYDTKIIIVSEAGAPTARIKVSPSTTGIVPFTVAFDAFGSSVNEESGSSITSYNWDFGDNNTGTGIIITHTYNTIGLYSVILTIIDSNGKKAYATVPITVNEEPAPEIGNIIVSANPESNVPGGMSIITAIVTNEEGDVVPDGTTVYLYTNSGKLSADSSKTTNGIAKVNLTLDDNMLDGETAKVTAFIGTVSGYIEVKCIDIIITISANYYSIAPGGTSTITAVVTKADGTPIEDVIVIFFAKDNVGNDIGTLNPVYCPTNATGIAATTLTLKTEGEVATVNAKCGSRVSNKITITCE